MKKVDAQVEHEVLRHHLVDGWPIGTLSHPLIQRPALHEKISDDG